MPAQDADGAGVVEEAVREPFELDLDDARSSSLRPSSSSRCAIVWASNGASAACAKSGSWGRGSTSRAGATNRSQARTVIASRASAEPVRRSPADLPGDELGLVALADALPGARQLGPGVRLVPVHPAAAELDGVPAPVVVPGAAAEPVARLDQRAVEARERQLARGGDPGEPPADDDGVEHARSLADS